MLGKLSKTTNLQVMAVYAISIACGLNFWSTSVLDPDLGWHLFGGAWISEHFSVSGLVSPGDLVPQKDFVNTFRTDWHDYHWLGQLVLYGIYSLGSYELLSIALGLLMAYLAKVMVDIIRISGGLRKESPLTAILLIAAAMYFLRSITTVRPQALSILFLALALRRLLGPKMRWEIAYLFLLTVLCAAVHVYWIFLPLLWLVYRCIDRIRKPSSITFLYAWGGFLLLGAAPLVSPYGLFGNSWQLGAILTNYALVWDYLHTPLALKNISEFRPLLSNLEAVPLLFTLAAICSIRTFRAKRTLAFAGDAAIFVGSGVLAFQATKFVGVFAVFALPYLSRLVLARLRRMESHCLAPVLKHGLLAAILIAALGRAIVVFPAPGSRVADISAVYPIEACRTIAKLSVLPSHDRDHVRILTHFNYGGWCRWAAFTADPRKEVRVTTDGRTQGVPDEHFERSSNLYALREGWDKTLADWAPDVILTSREMPISYLLFRAPGEWKLEYRDNQFAVFIPNK